MNMSETFALKSKSRSIQIGFCMISKDMPELVKCIDILSLDELAYYESIKFIKRKQSYLLGRIAAKRSISTLLGLEEKIKDISIQFGVFEQPIVKSPSHQNIQVSISHSHNYGVALAFPEEHPMAIDIEIIEDKTVEIMSEFISTLELRKIESYFSNLSVGATLVWSIKETLSKVLKTGLTTDFRIFEIESLEKKGMLYLSKFKFFTQYEVVSLIRGSFALSMVLPRFSFPDLASLQELLEKLS